MKIKKHIFICSNCNNESPCIILNALPWAKPNFCHSDGTDDCYWRKATEEEIKIIRNGINENFA